MTKYRRITEEQRTIANSTDLYSFLTSHGEQLQRHGSGYKLVYTENGQKHDSITINGNQWYDHKNQIGGGAIKFVENYYGSSYPEAVEMLLGFSSVPSSNITRVSNVNTQLPIRKEFKLPKANSDMKRVFAYLTKTRHISGDIVSFFAHKKMIYESLEYYNDKTTGEQKEAHNVVFLGRDKEGTAKQANKRSIATYGKSFRMTVSGSDTNFSFCHIGTDDMILVFEAPIDMLSFITLYPADWQKHSYIALDGISERSLLQALSDYPHLQHVVLCTDNDEGGIDAAERIRDILYSKGYQHIGRATSQAKDWNEDLKHNYGEEYIPANVHPLKNAVANVVDEIEPQNDTLSPGFEDLLAEGLYTDIAALALDHSVQTLKLDDSTIDYTAMYEKLANRINKDFRAYREKGKPQTKIEQLTEQIKCAFKIGETDTCKSVAKRFYEIAQTAVSIEASMTLEMQQAQSEIIAETAVMTMGG